MQRLLPIAFAVEEDSDPQIVEIIPGEKYAAINVTDIVEAAPPPLAQIEQLVTRDYMLSEGSKKAKAVADVFCLLGTLSQWGALDAMPAACDP